LSSVSPSLSSPPSPPSPTQPPVGGNSLVMDSTLTAAARALGYRDVTCTLLVKEEIVTRGSVSSQSSLDPWWLDMSSGNGTSDSQDASIVSPGGEGTALATASGIRDGNRRRHSAYHELRCGLLLKVLNRHYTDVAEPVVGRGQRLVTRVLE
ncbi:hypothetical protein Vretifemale_10664, partial [Volvox reticuliferus]